MKNKLLNILMILIPLMALTSSCKKEEIVFDHEKPQFELRDDAILLEVIMPQGTATDDILYISGDFNGGDEMAVGNAQWQLEKAAGSDVKWGIYLYPNTFINGKTLADGFHFVSEKQGVERDVFNKEVIHAANASLGTRTNIMVSRWEAYFKDPDQPKEHDGYAIFVIDETGWDALSIYAWGNDIPELFGLWPGAAPTGTEVKNGVTYKYFDTGATNAGLTYNLIFNNANTGAQFDGPAFTLDHDIYLKITSTGYEEVGEIIKHDGYAIFLIDETGWDAITMYAWGTDIPELLGAWPGVAPTGEQTINGVTYKYFDTGVANVGLTYNLILNNNDGGKQFDLAGVTLNRDYYFRVDGSKGAEIDPNNPNPEEPVIPPVDPKTCKIYVTGSTGWSTINLYAWGADIPELFGEWPGASVSGTEIIGGVEFKYFQYNVSENTYNLIFNDGSELKLPDVAITANRNYYFSLSATEAVEIDPQQ